MIIDAKSLNMAPVIDPVAAVVLCADVSNVDTVIVAGQVKKRDGKLLADVDKARADVEASRDHLLAAAAEKRQLSGGHLVRPAGAGRAGRTDHRLGGAATGYRRWPGGRRGRRCRAHRVRDLRARSGRLRSRCTCTPSRRASTSSTGTAVDRHRRGVVPASAGRLRGRPGRRCRTGWRNLGELPVQWAEMQAPTPRSAYDDDTFLVTRPGVDRGGRRCRRT